MSKTLRINNTIRENQLSIGNKGGIPSNYNRQQEKARWLADLDAFRIQKTIEAEELASFNIYIDSIVKGVK